MLGSTEQFIIEIPEKQKFPIIRIYTAVLKKF